MQEPKWSAPAKTSKEIRGPAVMELTSVPMRARKAVL